MSVIQVRFPPHLRPMFRIEMAGPRILDLRLPLTIKTLTWPGGYRLNRIGSGPQWIAACASVEQTTVDRHGMFFGMVCRKTNVMTLHSVTGWFSKATTSCWGLPVAPLHPSIVSVACNET